MPRVVRTAMGLGRYDGRVEELIWFFCEWKDELKKR